MFSAMESENAPRSAADALASLDLVDQARSDLADRLVTPWWYYLILGLIEAGFIVSFALPTAWRFLPVVLGCAALGVLVRAYSRVTGLGFSGNYWKLAGGWPVAVLGVVVAALLVVLVLDQFWATMVTAVVVFAAIIVLGRRADATIRARLRAGARAPR